MTDDLGELVAASDRTAEPRPAGGDGGRDPDRGAGPTDSGMIWLEGRPVTVPTGADAAGLAVRAQARGRRRQRRLPRRPAPRRRVPVAAPPAFYDLRTADGTPYSKIALLHLDSLASTVVQACNYWNTADQCGFCGIGLSLDSGATIAKKTPEQLAEVAVAARDLDGAVDVTLTTGSSTAPDRGARYVARCGRAVKDASGLPVEIQFEPPRDLAILDEVYAMGGADAVGIHIETFDPDVLARVAPGKARTGVETYFRTWERAVELWGRGRVSTYVILGMGEDPDVTVDGVPPGRGHRRLPVRGAAAPGRGSLMENVPAPSAAYSGGVYEQVAAHMTERGMSADDASPAARGARRARRSTRCSSRAAAGRSAARRCCRSAPDRGRCRDPRDRPPVHPGDRLPGGDRPGRARRAPPDPARRVRRGAGGVRRVRCGRRRRAPRRAARARVRRGRAVGTVRLYPLDETGLWQGDRLAVLPGRRSAGAGGPLVRFAVATAARAGGPA